MYFIRENFMEITRKNIEDIKITILTELYSGIYLSSERIDMGSYIFENYDELKNLPEKDNLFFTAFMELQDLKLVDCSNIRREQGVYYPRITGHGVQILDKVFINNNFENFLNNYQQEPMNLKNVILDKTIDNGVEKVVNYLLSSSGLAYNLILQGINYLPLI